MKGRYATSLELLLVASFLRSEILTASPNWETPDVENNFSSHINAS